MGLDRSTIVALVAELTPLVGARVQRVDELDRREIVLEIRLPGRTLRLLLSAKDAQHCVVLLVPKRPPRARPASDLQAALRRRMVGKRIERIFFDDGLTNLCLFFS